MGLIKSGFSAIGKLFIVIALAGTFLVGMGGVVYMSLQGQEIKVPEITGKDFVESEKELASLGLKIKRRADRYSTEKPNTILEQLPKPGETVKTGQMILVVTSKTNPEGQEEPTTIKKSNEEDDTDVIEDMISDKPKKTNKNTNTNSNKKKADTKRDVIGNKSNSNSNSSPAGNSDSGTSGNSTDKGNKNTGSTTTTTKTPAPPTVTKTPTGGDVRPRTTPKP
ncbi:MAG: PASTA domain-containing protein [Pyrinomonadaceae bacterium]|nr:PASTA domain-containing protein [Pyrinomonadaceae bacterium]